MVLKDPQVTRDVDDPNVSRRTVSIVDDDLISILQERRALFAQVSELQVASSKVADNTLRRQVAAFQLAAGFPVKTTPCVPAADRVRFRLRLVAEEFFELLEASGCFFPGYNPAAIVDNAITYLEHSRTDIVEVADACADIDYVVEGLRLEFGINGAPVALEVQRSNMAKCVDGKLVLAHLGDMNEGKVLKPAGWTPPDIAGVLRDQGWK